MKIHLMRLLCTAAQIVLATNLLAQSARLSGMVMDSSGARVPGASVVVTNTATGVARETLSNDLGLYVFEALVPGRYEVRCELPGFKKFVSTGNTLTVGQQAELNIRLDPGDVSDTVNITETIVPVQTTDSQVRTLITGTVIREVPLNGRNPLHLVLSGVPGVSGRGTGIYINGQKTQSNNTTLDGISVDDPTLGRAELSLVFINPDMLQEYQVVTSNFKPEYGRGTGAQVSLVTRSGSNEFHGSAYEFHRNTVFNANDFFNNANGVERPNLLRHQFGGTIGGPIKRNRAFFFFNYDAQRQSRTVPQNRTVFSSEARRGIFRYAQGVRNTPSLVNSSGNYIGSTPLLTYNVIENDATAIGADKVMAEIIKQMPLPNSFSGGDGLNTALFRFNAPSSNTNNTTTTRVDYTFNPKHSAFARYSYGETLTLGDEINTGLQRYPGLEARNQGSRRQGAAISLISTLSPRLLNEAVIGFTRSTVRFDNPQYPKALTIRLSSVENTSNPINDFAGSGRVAPHIELRDNVTPVFGAHTLKTGIDFRFYQFNQYRNSGTYNIYPRLNMSRTLGYLLNIPNQPAASVLESNNVNTLRSLMMDILGIYGRADQTFFSNGERYLPTGSPYLRGHRMREYDTFFQDDWKVRQGLTVNYGVRWEYRAPPFEVNGIMFVPNDRDFFNHSGTLSFNNVGKGGNARWFDSDLNNFGPSLGFAWDPKGDGKMSIRSSYRISYDRVTSSIISDTDQTTPGGSFDATLLNSGDIRTAGRVATFTSALAAPTTFSTTAPNERAGRPVLFDHNFRTPYVQQWMLSIQREVIKDTVVEVAYVGNKGTKLYRDYNINQTEIRNNGFLQSFLIAQKDLELATAVGASTGANYNAAIPGSRPVGIVATLNGGTIPSSQNADIQQGQAGNLAQTLDRPATLANAGLPDNFFRAYPQFELLGFGCTCSDSNYHSLQTQVVHRTNTFTLQGSWTYSRALDDFSGRGDGIGAVRDIQNRKLEKGPADFDATHIVRGSFVYDLPFGQGRTWANNIGRTLNQIIGGWQINGLFDAATGNPLTITSGRRTLAYTPLAAEGNSTADFIGNASSIRPTTDSQGRRILVTEEQRAQFSFPAAGSPGGTGRNAFRNPGFWNMNFSMYKNFRVTERAKLQFRSEFFNVFNHAVMENLPNERKNLSSADFGRFVAQRNDPRIMQFALKFEF